MRGSSRENTHISNHQKEYRESIINSIDRSKISRKRKSDHWIESDKEENQAGPLETFAVRNRWNRRLSVALIFRENLTNCRRIALCTRWLFLSCETCINLPHDTYVRTSTRNRTEWSFATSLIPYNMITQAQDRYLIVYPCFRVVSYDAK